MTKRRLGLLASFALSGTPSLATTVDVDGCGERFAWNAPDSLERESIDAYAKTSSGGMAPVQGFAEAMALRRKAKDAETRIFAEHWATLALYKSGLQHSAFFGFATQAGREFAKRSDAVQVAALSCLSNIHARYPTLDYPGAVLEKLSAYPPGTPRSRLALHAVKNLVGAGKVGEEVDRMVKLTDEGSPYRSLAQLLSASARFKHADVNAAAKAYFAGDRPADLVPLDDVVRVLNGRSFYSIGRFDEATNEFRQVNKASNHLARTLQELAWVFLKGERYKDALGTVINLHSGGFRRTFTPEAPMVMAMAFNEVCHYPESLKAVEAFREGYRESFEWLKAWNAAGGKADLYRDAVSFLRTPKESGIPARVATEWIRSPFFIGRQDEVNLLVDAETRSGKLSTSGADLQQKMAVEILALVQDIKPRYLKAKEADPVGELPLRVRQDLDLLKSKVTAYRRMKKGAPSWRLVMDAQSKRSATRKTKLVGDIKRDLAGLSKRMLAQLEDVADNIYFVEVEIFQGATQDMIWQNANPEFKKLNERLSQEKASIRLTEWNWGKIKGGLAGTHEVWDDELGQFRADLPDNCENKQKYLNIRRAISSTK